MSKLGKIKVKIGKMPVSGVELNKIDLDCTEMPTRTDEQDATKEFVKSESETDSEYNSDLDCVKGVIEVEGAQLKLKSDAKSNLGHTSDEQTMNAYNGD